MRIKTADLIGPALDWAVAKCEGVEYIPDHVCDALGHWYDPTCYSAFWAQGGPIIEREKIAIDVEHGDPWRARFGRPRLTFDGRATNYHHREGPTPLVAAMRCYVASKLGDEVEVPDALLS